MKGRWGLAAFGAMMIGAAPVIAQTARLQETADAVGRLCRSPAVAFALAGCIKVVCFLDEVRVGDDRVGASLGQYETRQDSNFAIVFEFD